MISDIPSAYSEPFVDSSQIPQLLISNTLEKMLYYQVTVAMNYLEVTIDIFIFNYYGISFQSSKN